MWEIDPLTGVVLNTLTVFIDGLEATDGLQALTTDPDTGIVYGAAKDPTGTLPAMSRLLLTLDVTTGQATSIGATGEFTRTVLLVLLSTTI